VLLLRIPANTLVIPAASTPKSPLREKVLDVTLQNIVGPWPENFPLLSDGKIEEGLAVWSKSKTIEGRTTGSRRPCLSAECEGWFIGVRWETGQMMYPCSKGWSYDPSTREVRVTGGGEISARTVSPRPEGVPPPPREDWPLREVFKRGKGWRVSPGAP
jgi:hypothetical protein